MAPKHRFRPLHKHAGVLAFAACAIPAWADSTLACDVPAPMRQALQPANLVLMGEMHGTVEAPAAFGATVCRALEQGLQVSVGLEFDREQGEALSRYLDADGGEAALDALLQSRFWSRTVQDGRGSVAMAALVERLRRLRQRYPELAVFALHDDRASTDAPAGPGDTSDALMAARVRAEREQRPQALILTLTGNVHNRVAPIMLAPPGRGRTPWQPMGVLLADLAPHAVSLASRGGSAWVCTGTCGVTPMPAPGPSNDDLLPPYRDLKRGDAYTSLWSLGPSTASPPAAHAFMR